VLDRLPLKYPLASTAAGRPRRSPELAALVATLVLGLAAVGCGSSSKSSTTSSTATPIPLSKPQFLAKGNAICEQGNRRLASAEKALGSKPTKTQIASFVAATFAPEIQSQIDGLRALGAPSGEQPAISNMLAAAQTDLTRIKRNPSLLAGGAGFTDFVRLAHPYGLTACASGG
jgi:hypothetical protein